MSTRRRRLQRLPVDVLWPRSRDPADERHPPLRLQVLLVLLRAMPDLPADRRDAPLPLTGHGLPEVITLMRRQVRGARLGQSVTRGWTGVGMSTPIFQRT